MSTATRPEPPATRRHHAPPADGAPPGRGPSRLVAWCIAAPKRTLALWLVVMIAVTVGGFSMTANELRDSQSGSGESRQADAALERGGLQSPIVEVVAVRAATPEAADRAARQVAEAWATVPGTGPVAGIGEGGRAAQRSADGRTVLLQTTIAGELADAEEKALQLRERATDAARDAGATAHQSGVASITADSDARTLSGMRTVELLSLPATLIILLLTFGSAVAAVVPLALAILAVAAGLALGNAASGLVPLSEATASVVVLLGLATTVDYSLFCVKRFREELADGAVPEAAARATMATVGRAVLVAGSTVVIALSAMIIAGSAIFTSMAVGSMLVVAVGVLTALTALPAILTLLGRRIDAGRLPWARAGAQRSHIEGGRWAAVSGRVVRRPGRSLAAVTALLLLLAAPALNLRFASSDTTTLPQDLPAIQALHEIERSFPSGPSPATVVITGNPARLAAASATIDAIGQAAMRAAGGRGTVTRTTAQDGGTIALSVPARDAKALDVDAQADAVRAAVAPLRPQLGEDATVQVTGMGAASADFADAMRRATPIVVGFVLLLAFALLRGTFGSTPLAIGVISLNLLSIAATYGLITAIFQGTWAEGLLGFTSIGAVVDWLPLFAFVVLFGLSMDYTVIVLERIREARAEGLDPARATVIGLSHTAVAVTSAASVMVVVFGLFGLVDFLDLKMLGIGMALAVLLDATIVRAIGLPALVALVGDRWQPRAARTTVSRQAPALESA